MTSLVSLAVTHSFNISAVIIWSFMLLMIYCYSVLSYFYTLFCNLNHQPACPHLYSLALSFSLSINSSAYLSAYFTGLQYCSNIIISSCCTQNFTHSSLTVYMPLILMSLMTTWTAVLPFLANFLYGYLSCVIYIILPSLKYISTSISKSSVLVFCIPAENRLPQGKSFSVPGILPCNTVFSVHALHMPSSSITLTSNLVACMYSWAIGYFILYQPFLSFASYAFKYFLAVFILLFMTKFNVTCLLRR